MELTLKWDRKDRDPRRGADIFAFELRQAGSSKYVQVSIPDQIREAIQEQFGSEWAVMQVALGKAKQHLSSPDALRERVDNVVVQNEMDPLEGEPLSGVDLHCYHLIGRDRSARCEVARDEFAGNPAGCIPGKNECWRQVYLKD